MTTPPSSPPSDPDFQPGELAARLAAAHARLATARDTSDILAAVAAAAAPYGLAHADLRYLYLDDDGRPEAMQALAVWQGGALVHDHPFLGLRIHTADTALSPHWVARPRELLVIPDAATDDRCDDQLRRAIAPRRGIVLAPLHSAAPDAWQGLLVLQWQDPHTPGPAELLLYRTLQHTVAALVAGLRSALAFESALAEARALYRVSARIVEAASPADLLAVVTDLALSAGAAHGALLLVEDETLHVAAAHAAAPEQRPATGARHPLTALPDPPIWQRDPDAPISLGDDADAPPLFGTADLAAALLLPLRWQGRAIGFVHLGWREPHRFSDPERRLFRGLARQAAAVLDNRLLWDRTQRAIADQRSQQQMFETLLHHLPIGVTVLDRDGNRVRMNRAGLQIHDLPEDTMRAGGIPPELRTYHVGTDRRIRRDERLSVRAMATGQLVSGDVEVERRDGRRLTVAGTAAPSRDEHGALTGCVLLFQDITDRIAAERDQLRVQNAILAAQSAALAERATPLIPLTDDILVMPIVGTIDPDRGHQIQTSLLHMGGHTGIRAAILDLTGVPTLGEDGAEALLDTARALRLRGVVPILSGLRPDVAWTLVALDTDLGELCVESDLQSALARATRLRR